MTEIKDKFDEIKKIAVTSIIKNYIQILAILELIVYFFMFYFNIAINVLFVTTPLLTVSLIITNYEIYKIDKELRK